MPRITTPIVASLATVGAMLLGGCGEGSIRDRTAGVWSVDARRTKLDPNLPFMNRLKRLAYGTSLKLRRNGTFHLASVLSFRGTWTVDPAGNVVLTPNPDERYRQPVTLTRRDERLVFELQAPVAFAIPIAPASPQLVLRKSG